MGLFGMLRGQAIDVIDWVDSTQDTIVHKYDCNGKEIMMGAQLTVRESQLAVFVNEGQIADIFQPGRYQLQTANMPIMTALQSWRFGFNSPFKADVYFISTRQFLDRKWGTTNPVMMRDPEFGVIRLRGFGSFSFRVTDPEALLKECFGTSRLYRVEDIEGQIKRLTVSCLSDAIAESAIPALDLAANYDELSGKAMLSINAKLAGLGVQLSQFVIENISLPEEVEQALDRRTSMGVVGDLGRYTQYQAAEALREGANASGAAGSGIGMGAGMAMGQMMAQSLQQNMSGTAAQPAQAAAASSFCPDCGQKLAAGARFCPGCGKKLAGANVCPSCGKPVAEGARFCSGCGQKL